MLLESTRPVTAWEKLNLMVGLALSSSGHIEFLRQVVAACWMFEEAASKERVFISGDDYGPAYIDIVAGHAGVYHDEVINHYKSYYEYLWTRSKLYHLYDKPVLHFILSAPQLHFSTACLFVQSAAYHGLCLSYL